MVTNDHFICCTRVLRCAVEKQLEALKMKLRRWPGTKVQLQGGQVQVTKPPKQRPATLTYR